MKKLHIVLLLVMVTMSIPAALLAQEAATTIDLPGALAIVREAYGQETTILAVRYDADHTCWQFEFADGTTVCVDETTGEILLDLGTDSGAVNNVDDGAVDNVDDGAVNNVDDGAVDNVDDGAVNNVDDGAVNDQNADSGILPITTLEEAIATALSLFPNSVVTSVSFQAQGDGMFTWNIGLDGVFSVDVDAVTGEVLLSDDGAVDNVDDGAVNNVDDGAVENTDDGQVGNQDDGNQGNQDDGQVGNQDDGNQGNQDQGNQGN